MTLASYAVFEIAKAKATGAAEIDMANIKLPLANVEKAQPIICKLMEMGVQPADMIPVNFINAIKNAGYSNMVTDLKLVLPDEGEQHKQIAGMLQDAYRALLPNVVF
ncbi:hypothetical protein HNP86_001957 [Methanococcus maripaludis]|uniref:Uncharacterized protein n=1 Tax=Methanococcus maripaludis TaxID=39152 RepID=A0A7J9NVT6_METMI|nr:hypothetical protein [Methanococcus maripaludis]MBA2851798.1 hypothetical protein [Methanococcus maripaludis]